MAIYSRTGDRGKTGLFSGERVGKDNDRIEACGSLDELSSVLGALAASLPPERDELIQMLQGIQADLFTIGARVSAMPDSHMAGRLESIEAARVVELESGIDAFKESLPELTHFIIPGGQITSAWAHIARSVCRRVERRVVRVFRGNPGAPESGIHATILCYLNRLSDYLFMLARYCNFIEGVQDIEWTP